MLPEMLEPAVCVKKNHTATFLILDITDKLSKHTRRAFKVQGCSIRIFSAATRAPTLFFFFYLPSPRTRQCRGALNLTTVVIVNLKGVRL